MSGHNCKSCGYPSESLFDGNCKHCISSAAPESHAANIAAAKWFVANDRTSLPVYEKLIAAIAKATERE